MRECGARDDRSEERPNPEEHVQVVQRLREALAIEIDDDGVGGDVDRAVAEPNDDGRA